MKEFVEKLISRLEELQNDKYYNGSDRFSVMEKMVFNICIEYINHYAEEYNNGWIYCSERLPDDFMSFEYLTIRKGHTKATITYYCVVNHKWYSNLNSTKEIDVIAWMPLPEPYQKGE